MASGPNTKITTMRLPKDLMKMLDRRAKKNQVSRTRLIEWLLRDYVAKPETELRDIVTGPRQEVVDARSIDIFN